MHIQFYKLPLVVDFHRKKVFIVLLYLTMFSLQNFYSVSGDLGMVKSRISKRRIIELNRVTQPKLSGGN